MNQYIKTDVWMNLMKMVQVIFQKKINNNKTN